MTPTTVIAESAQFAVTCSVIYGFTRLFADRSFMWPLVALALFVQLVVMTVRRLGLGVAWSAVATTVGCAVFTTWLWFPSTTRWLLPTGATVSAARDAMSEAATAFQELHAPVPPIAGFVVGASIAIAITVFLADWAAFRLWSPLESLVPGLTIFVFTTVLTAEQHRFASGVAFAATICAFLAAHHVATVDPARTRPRTTGRDSAGRDSAGRDTARRDVSRDTARRDVSRYIGRGAAPDADRWVMLATGAALSSIAVLVGAFVGPHVPGTSEAALYDWREVGSNSSSRVTVSPLVDIRSRLVDQSDRELFTVESPQPAYWRVTALDTFDGTIWRSSGRYGRADGKLGHSEIADPGPPIRQIFDITGLDALWLPAAFQPVDIDPGDVAVRYQEESATLIVDTDIADSNGITYTVESVIPRFRADQLRQASSSDAPGRITERYAGTPEGLSESARQTARDAVAGTNDNPYDEALALQDFFRDNFTYDLEVPSGHGDNAIDAFLDVRRGYCEQFAGTYAALARSVGIPARVAVGFTWGDQDPGDRTRFVVLGRHAHAWPEVYLAGFGWVPFEPTPGRGMPGAGAWTGIDQSQATSSEVIPATPTTDGAATQPIPGTDDESATASVPPNPQNEPTPTTAAPAAPDHTTHRSPWRSPLVWVAIVVFALCCWIMVAARLARGAIPEVDADDDAARVRRAWRESEAGLAVLGTRRLPDETHDEYARRGAELVPQHSGALRQLASDTDAATFAVGVVDREVAERSEQTSAKITETVRARTSWLRRTLEALR